MGVRGWGQGLGSGVKVEIGVGLRFGFGVRDSVNLLDYLPGVVALLEVSVQELER